MNRYRVSVVREAGGYGDVVCLGGVSRALKNFYPDCRVTLFVSDCWVAEAEHLYGVDRVITLGEAHRNLRPRKAGWDTRKYPHLTIVEQYPYDKIVDCFCPGVNYEMSTEGRLEFTRSVLFARAAGVPSDLYSVPIWLTRESERVSASTWLTLKGITKRPVVGVCLRTTSVLRSYPDKYSEELLTRLVDQGFSVIYFDCVNTKFSCPVGVTLCTDQDFCDVAAIVEQCDLVVSVDTSILHLSQAVGTPCIGIFSSTDPHPFKLFYDQVTAVDGHDNTRECWLACNSRSQKGDYSKCVLEMQCRRMELNTPDRIFDTVIQVLRRNTDEPKTLCKLVGSSS